METREQLLTRVLRRAVLTPVSLALLTGSALSVVLPETWPVAAFGFVAEAVVLQFLARDPNFVRAVLNEERQSEGDPPVTLVQHMEGPQFWFESFQNWQSEFVAVLSIVVLSIWLRQDKSPESKPVAAPHRQTGA